MPPIYGVLRGEIAVPTKTGAAAVAGAILTLTDAAHRIAVWTPHWQCRFTMISRTGWQILLPGPALTLRAMLLVQARLAGSPDRLTCRMVIGLGGMDRFGDTSLTDAAGPALTAALPGMPNMMDLLCANVGRTRGNSKPGVSCGVQISGFGGFDALKWVSQPSRAARMARNPAPVSR